MVGLLQACDDPALFGAGFAPWPRQRELLAAIEAGPQVHVLALGRRSGKSTMAAAVLLHNLLLMPELDALVRPGETRVAVAVGTNVGQARLIVQAARSILMASPMLRGLLVAENQDSLQFRLPSGARSALMAFPCSSGVRGYAVSAAVMDEAAFFFSESDGATGASTAKRIFDALEPATAQFGAASRLLVCSTPMGSDGHFADLYARAASGERADAAAHHATTRAMNPVVTDEYLAAKQAADPESYAAEYEAAFIGSGGAYLDFDRFAVVPRGEPSPHDAGGWIAGLDPSFAGYDAFGLALVGRGLDDPRRMVLGPVRAFKPAAGRAQSFDAKRQAQDELLGQVIELCRRYNATAVTDQYESVATVERLQRAGIAVRVNNMTAPSKTAAFAELRARLYDQTLELRDDPDLTAELRRLRTKRTAGQATVVNPRVGGSHGDRAQALALAVYEQALRGGGTNGHARSGGGSLMGDLLGYGAAMRQRPGGDPPEPDFGVLAL
jgi:hypothetical protein